MITDVGLLDQKLKAAGIPIAGISKSNGAYVVQFLPEATQQQRNQANAIVASFDPVAEQANLETIAADIVARGSGALAWFEANPATKQIFTLSIADLETEINTLVDAVIPLATAANRTRVKKLFMVWSLHTRIYAKERGWV